MTSRPQPVPDGELASPPPRVGGDGLSDRGRPGLRVVPVAPALAQAGEWRRADAARAAGAPARRAALPRSLTVDLQICPQVTVQEGHALDSSLLFSQDFAWTLPLPDAAAPIRIDDYLPPGHRDRVHYCPAPMLRRWKQTSRGRGRTRTGSRGGTSGRSTGSSRAGRRAAILEHAPDSPPGPSQHIRGAGDGPRSAAMYREVIRISRDWATAAVLHERYLEDVFRYVLRRVPSVPEAEDITAEVFAAAAAASPAFPGQCSPLSLAAGHCPPQDRGRAAAAGGPAGGAALGDDRRRAGGRSALGNPGRGGGAGGGARAGGSPAGGAGPGGGS